MDKITVEKVNDTQWSVFRNGIRVGSFEYEKGVGVFARRTTSEQASFLTNGYRATIGSYGGNYHLPVATAKRLAREFIAG